MGFEHVVAQHFCQAGGELIGILGSVHRQGAPVHA